MSHITPIPKSGDKTNVKDYRPICTLNTISKVLETLILNNIKPQTANKII